MTIAPGTTLAHYQILGSLGAGGMGEVYHARDTSLGREVAIKVLPQELAGDAERLKRFEREARMLATLNHSNIGQIYGFERAGADSFLVLEYIPGEDLSKWVERAPLVQDEAVEIARQVALGLEAAHDLGVVHRDLKPANVRVTPDGTCKLLDFGLSKSVSSTAQQLSPQSLTTQEGTLLGTPPYMSPEQARGAPVSHRSDVWAFGCLFYELLTGKQPFTGKTIVDLITAILEREPDWEPIRDPRLRQLLQRCLTKDPARRLQHIGEARIALEDLAAGVPAPAAAAHRGSRGLLALAAVLVAAAAAWIVLGPDGARAPQLETRLNVPVPLDRSIVRLDNTAPPFDLSPDGRTLVYVARGSHGAPQLFVHRLGEFEPQPIEGTEQAGMPFFSPDGEWVGYFAEGALKRVPISGGTSFEVCKVSISERGSGTWNADGTILFTVGLNTGGWLSRVPATGGEPEIVASPNPAREEAWFGTPHFLPGGKRALVTVSSAAGLRTAVLELATGKLAEVAGTGEASGARYAGGGVLVFCQAGNLMAARFDPGRGELRGPARQVLESVYGPGIGPLYYAVSPAGTVVFMPGGAADSSLVITDRNGKVQWRSAERGVYQHPRFSPDGTRVAYDAQRLDGRDLWVYEPRGARTRLTRSGVNLDPQWTRDGDRVIFRRNAGAGTQVYLVGSDGRGEPEPVPHLTSANYLQIPGTWSPEGDLLYTVVRGIEIDIWQASRAGGTRELIGGPHNVGWPALSRSGKLLAYSSDETGRNEVYLCSYPDLTGRQAVSAAGGVEPVWGGSDDELFFRNGTSFYSVSLTPGERIVIGEPELLLTGAYDMAPSGHQHYDVSSDGQRLLLVETGQDASAGQLRVILNWAPQLVTGQD